MSTQVESQDLMSDLEERIRRHLTENGPAPFALPFWVNQPQHRNRYYDMLERFRADGLPYLMVRRIDETNWIIFTL